MKQNKTDFRTKRNVHTESAGKTSASASAAGKTSVGAEYYTSVHPTVTYRPPRNHTIANHTAYRKIHKEREIQTVARLQYEEKGIASLLIFAVSVTSPQPAKTPRLCSVLLYFVVK